MKPLIVVLLLSIALFSNPVFSDETSDQLEQMDKKLDILLESQEKNYKIITDDPLKGRKFGVEFNIPRLLVFKDERALSGGFSIFDHKRNVEYAFPIFYQNTSDDNYWSENGGRNSSLRVTTLDFHYRAFLGDRLNGFYMSAFTRLAHLKGSIACDYSSMPASPPEKSSPDNFVCDSAAGSETKLGVGVGIGFRIFSSKRIYWGASLSAGRYITGEKHNFEQNSMDDEAPIIDVEFLKFGWAF